MLVVRSDYGLQIADIVLSNKFRYWNDPEVLKKIGQAMGGSFPFGTGSSAEPSGAEETEEGGDEDESIVHHTASVGDDEVMEILIKFCFIFN